jgi:hypothetical protein
MDWKPEENAFCVGDMLRHLWVCESGVRQCALEGNFAYCKTRIPARLRAVRGLPGSLEQESKHIDCVHRETLSAAAMHAAELFDKERAHPEWGFRRIVAGIVAGMNEHEAHHRAQLMTYVRMMGTLPLSHSSSPDHERHAPALF